MTHAEAHFLSTLKTSGSVGYLLAIRRLSFAAEGIRVRPESARRLSSTTDGIRVRPKETHAQVHTLHMEDLRERRLSAGYTPAVVCNRGNSGAAGIDLIVRRQYDGSLLQLREFGCGHNRLTRKRTLSIPRTPESAGYPLAVCRLRYATDGIRVRPKST